MKVECGEERGVGGLWGWKTQDECRISAARKLLDELSSLRRRSSRLNVVADVRLDGSFRW